MSAAPIALALPTFAIPPAILIVALYAVEHLDNLVVLELIRAFFCFFGLFPIPPRVFPTYSIHCI